MTGVAVPEVAVMAWHGLEAVGMMGHCLEAIDMSWHVSDDVGMT